MTGDPGGRASSTVRRAFIGLGSNLGDRRAALRRAVAQLREGGDVTAVSPLYETEPVGGPADQGHVRQPPAAPDPLPGVGRGGPPGAHGSLRPPDPRC